MGDEEKTREQLINDLRKCEKHFKPFFDISLIGISVVSPDLQWIEVSDSFCKMVGYSREELLKGTWPDITPKEDLVSELTEYYGRIRSGDVTGYTLEKRFIKNDGIIIDVAVSVNPVQKNDGSIDCLVAIIQDISERQQAEKSLRTSESQYKTLVESSPDAIMMLDTKNKIVSCNEAFLTLFGYQRKEVEGVSIRIIYPSRESYYNFIHAANVSIMKENVFSAEFEFVRKNGGMLPVESSTSAVKDTDGSIIGYVAVLRDITRRKQVEEALRRSEEKYHNIFNNAVEGIFQTTPEGGYISVNPSFARMFGFSSPEEMKKSVINIESQIYVNPEDRERLKHLLTKHGIVERFEAQVYRKDKSKFWISINAHAVRDSAGATLYYEGTNEDITERKRAEELLKESENKFHLLFEKSFDPVILLYDYKYVDCNEASVRLMGYSSKEDLIGLHPGQTSPEFQPDGEKSFVKARDIIDRTMREGSSRFEWVHKKVNGEEFWSDVSLTAITIGGKDFIYDVWKDITNRKNMEAELKKSEIRYRQMFENNPLPVLVFDFNTLEIIDVNKAAIIHYGYTHEEFTGMTVKELHLPAEVPEILSYIYGPELGTKRGPWRHVKKDGTLIDAEISGHPLEFSGKLCRIAIVNDITDRKKAEEELKRSYEQLRILSTHINQAREKERKDVARELHDELGQILTTLNMDISWIKRRMYSKIEDTVLLEKANAMSVLIKQAIKSVQKVSAELRPVILDDFGLAPAIEWAVNKFKIQTDIDAKITIGEGIDLDGERSTQIYRIIQESLTNIARHASATKLYIRLEKEGNNIVLEIKDNGKGISDKEKADLNSFGILGMRERAIILGGDFIINGIRGKGTTVRVRMPFDSQVEREGEAGAPASRVVALPMEGATQAPIKENNDKNSHRR